MITTVKLFHAIIWLKVVYGSSRSNFILTCHFHDLNSRSCGITLEIINIIRKSCSCINRAKVYFSEGELRKMKKMIVHCFRYLLFGKQLVQHGRITVTDKTCHIANNHRTLHALMSTIVKLWLKMIH